MIDYELLLFDRIKIIQDLNDKYDLLNNSYLSFSGGKDSTIVHYLLDVALPNNNIPRVYFDTGLEYSLMRDYVYNLSKKDNRFIIIKSGVNIHNMLSDIGYPFKSKLHSKFIFYYQNGLFKDSVNKYLNGRYFKSCPSILKYQFTDSFKLKVSDLCCQKMKKDIAFQYSQSSHRSILITGMRAEEGGFRELIKGCALYDKDHNLKKFHPLLVVDDGFENFFINKYSVQLCSLYYPPFNFKRTGCKGCPYNPFLSDDLRTMKLYLHNDYLQSVFVWKPVYDEYVRIGYRLKDGY